MQSNNICPGQKNTFENTVNVCPLVKLDCLMRAFSNGSFSSVDKQAFDGYEIGNRKYCYGENIISCTCRFFRYFFFVADSA